MSVVITLDDIKAYAEVDYIINHMNKKYRDMLPEKLKKFFSDYKDYTYEVKINPYVPLEQQGLKKYALEIIALLHLRYWCEDESRKKELYEIMLNNQEKLENQIREKYDIDNIFSNNFDDTLENTEPQDFSRPKVIQKYEQYTKNNEDIKDYTDYEDNEIEPNKELVSQNSDEKKNILQIIKEKILSILKK